MGVPTADINGDYFYFFYGDKSSLILNVKKISERKKRYLKDELQRY